MKPLSIEELQARFAQPLKTANEERDIRIHRIGPPPATPGGWRMLALSVAMGVVTTFCIGGSGGAQAASPDHPALFDSQLQDIQRTAIDRVIENGYSEHFEDRIPGRVDRLHDGRTFSSFIRRMSALKGRDGGQGGSLESFRSPFPNEGEELVSPVAQQMVFEDENRTRFTRCAVLLPTVDSMKDGHVALGKTLYGSIIDEVSRQTGQGKSLINETLMAGISGQYKPIPGDEALSRKLAIFSATFIAGHEAGHCAYLSRNSIVDGSIEANAFVDLEAFPDISGARQALLSAQSDDDRHQIIRWLDLFADQRLQTALATLIELEQKLDNIHPDNASEKSLEVNALLGQMRPYERAAYAMKGFLSAYRESSSILSSPLTGELTNQYLAVGEMISQQQNEGLYNAIESSRRDLGRRIEEIEKRPSVSSSVESAQFELYGVLSEVSFGSILKTKFSFDDQQTSKSTMNFR